MLCSFKNSYFCFVAIKINAWPTIFAPPHITHFERKNSRTDIPTLTVYDITAATILKYLFHEAKNEKVHIRINLNALKLCELL